jgi:tetratricopeptide (TPR) repeat protein
MKELVRELQRLFWEGWIATSKRDYLTAERNFTEVLRCEEWLGLNDRRTMCLYWLGNVCAHQGRYKEAVDFLEKCLDLAERGHEVGTVNFALDTLSDIFIELGRYEDALANTNRGIKFYQSSNEGDSLHIRWLIKLGDLYTLFGKYDESLSTYRQALETSTSMESRFTVISHLAQADSAFGQNDRAAEWANQAMGIANEVRSESLKVHAILLQAQVYKEIGDFSRAIVLLESGLPFVEEKYEDEDWSELAVSLFFNLANLYELTGYYEKAWEMLDRFEAAEASSHKLSDEVRRLNARGNILLDQHKYEEALGYYLQAVEKAKVSAEPNLCALTWHNLSTAYHRLGRTEEAIEASKASLKYSSVRGDPLRRLEGFNSLGIIYKLAGRLEEAREALAAECREWELANSVFVRGSDIANLQARLKNMHGRYADVLVALHRKEEALIAVESGRVKGLAFEAMRARLQNGRMESEKLRKIRETAGRWESSRNRVETLMRKLAELNEKEADITAVSEELARAKLEHEQVGLGLQSETADMLGAESHRMSLHLCAFEDLLTVAKENPDTLFLEWSMVYSGTWLLFAFGHKSPLEVFRTEISDPADAEEGLAPMVNEWLDSICALLEHEEKGDEHWQRAMQEPIEARKISTVLLQLLEDAKLLDETKYKRLAIVLDGPLLRIPVGALVDSSGKRLIERFSISIQPSFSMFRWSWSTETPDRDFLGIIGPDRTFSDPLRGKFSPIESAATEVRDILKLFSEGRILKAPKRTDVLQEIARYRFVHFAVHGWWNAANGLVSALMCSDGVEGFVEARDMLGIGLTARLTALSACTSALGDVRGGEGIMGWCWTLHAAGCPCVLASWWPVDDEKTRRLMKEFYQNMLLHERIDDALRDAILTTREHLRDLELDYVFFWAPFQIAGCALRI